MKKVYLVSVLLFVGSVVNAGMLDILQDGIKGNPDRYVSVDLLATWAQQEGLTSYPTLPDQQSSLNNDRGIETLVRFPLTENMTLLLGGNWDTGQSSYSQGATLPPYTGVTQGFGCKAGLRFYIHN